MHDVQGIRQYFEVTWITRTRLAGDPPDVLLCPRLGEFAWLDFHRANEAIAEGLASVQAAEPTIRRACRDAIADL